MSMRIQDNYQSSAAAEAARTVEVSRPPASGKGTPSGATSAADQVDISPFSGKVADAVAAQESQQADRVRQLSAVYASGNLQVDSAKVAKAMVSQAIGGASGAQEE